jgi:hypothetical protein
MQAFTDIRRKAIEKRDRAIAQARREYAETLARIAALEQDVLGRDPSNHKTISSCINRVLPSDREFTVIDVLAGLEGLDPGRVWRRRSVDSHIFRLIERGVVRRVRKSRGTEPAIYARVGLKLPKRPFENKTLPEAIAEVLGEKAMTPAEIAVALLDAGYETVQTPRSLQTHIRVELRKGRFKREGKKWGLSKQSWPPSI